MGKENRDITVVRTTRAIGEPKNIPFSEEKHAGLIARAAKAGLMNPQIAMLIGVRRDTFESWVQQHDVVRAALAHRMTAVLDVIEALHDTAVGTVGEDGVRKGVNVRAAEVYLKHAAKLPAPDEPGLGDDMDDQELTDAAGKIMNELRRRARTRQQAPPIDVTPEPVDAEGRGE